MFKKVANSSFLEMAIGNQNDGQLRKKKRGGGKGEERQKERCMTNSKISSKASKSKR
jgi:hypothetical protein